MGRYTGDYLLGTTFLAAAMLVAMLQGKSDPPLPTPAANASVTTAALSSQFKSASNPRHQPSISSGTSQPACAVLKGLSRGTRIVVGSLDVSGLRHALSITVRNDDSERSESMSVVECSFNDLRRIRYIVGAIHPKSSVAIAAPQLDKVGQTIDLGSNGSTHRVFLTPHFLDAGTVHEPAECRLMGKSPRTQVFVDQRLLQSRDVKKISDWFQRLTTAAETRALPLVDAWIGAISDIDHDQRLSIVITDLDQRKHIANGSSPINGCIRDADFQRDADFCGDIVYIDPRVFELPSCELAALLTHEISHAAVCSIRDHVASGLPDATESGNQFVNPPVPSWLNEAVAHFVELQCSLSDNGDVGVSENFQRRMDDFLANPAGSPIVAAEDVLSLEERRSGSRGAATLFLARWFSSSETLQQFLRSDAALDRRIESLAQEPFADVFREWTLSLATTTHKDHSLRIDVLPAAGNHAQFSLLGTAFRCFECPEDVESLVIESDIAAQLQISIIEPEVQFRTIATADRQIHAAIQ